MKEFKGTKGDWKVVHLAITPFYKARFEVQYGQDGECIAEHVHDEHNAKLIAAAPDLLEVAQEIVNLYRIIHNDNLPHNIKPIVLKAKQAIEKAL